METLCLILIAMYFLYFANIANGKYLKLKGIMLFVSWVVMAVAIITSFLKI